MLGSGKARNGLGSLPEETDEERQQRLSLLQSKRLHGLINELCSHLGHWSTTSKQNLESLAAGTSRYEPSLRFAEAVGDLRKLLVPGLQDDQVYGGHLESIEEVARMMEAAGMVSRHLAPLLIALPPGRRYLPAALQISID